MQMTVVVVALYRIVMLLYLVVQISLRKDRKAAGYSSDHLAGNVYYIHTPGKQSDHRQITRKEISSYAQCANLLLTASLVDNVFCWSCHILF